MTIYENLWCKVIHKDNYYILKSKSGKYNDQFHNSLDSLCKQAGLTKSIVLDYVRKQRVNSKQGLT
jgi:hypothetical protein